MEIKPCPFCGAKADIDFSVTTEYQGHDYQYVEVACTCCGAVVCSDAKCSCCSDIAAIVIDKWNCRVEQPSEADRWLKEATEQRARADLLQMQNEELIEALEQAKRMLDYAGKMQ